MGGAGAASCPEGSAAGPLPGGRGQEPRSLPVGGAAGVPGDRGLPSRGPTSTAPGLRQRPARRRTLVPGAFARGTSVAATVLSPASGLRGPSLAHTAQPPGVPLGPGQAQLPDGRGRPFRTRTLATLRFLGNLTVLRRKI